MSFINAVNGDLILGNIIALEGQPSILKHIRKCLHYSLYSFLYTNTHTHFLCSAIDHPLSSDVSEAYMIY